MSKTQFDSWEPISEDDETLKAVLEKANIPVLIVSLAMVTGDMSLIRGEIRPKSRTPFDRTFGVSEEQQAQVRAQALEILKNYRDRGCPLAPPSNVEQVREMMDFMVGEPLPADYGKFLMAELLLDGRDPFEQPGLQEIPPEKRAAFHVIIIGSGMSGILAAFRLEETGIAYTVIEKNANVGGTWYENTYPGCRVDNPNHTYSYSFKPQDWPKIFSTQPVLREYFTRCADEFGIRPNIRFKTSVESAEYDEITNTWTVRIEGQDGARETLQANAIISAVGQLNRPKLPEIEGRKSFKGIAFHTARWQHEHDLTGKRIAVVGTGASAFQSVPEIAQQAEEVYVFQRTPNWIIHIPEYHDDYSEEGHWLNHHLPYYAKWFRLFLFWQNAEGILKYVQKDEAWPHQTRSISALNEEIRELFTEGITKIVGDDKELLEKCIPPYPPAGKRMLLDNGHWLRALKRENVHLITDPIDTITETGLRSKTNGNYEVDVILYACGFYPSRMLWPMTIKGRGGVDLQEHWDGDPRAYLGITIPQFPNLFCMYGPNTNIVANGSIIFFSECEMRYILGCFEQLLRTGQAALDCKSAVHDSYNQWIDEGNLNRPWGAPHVNSWYKSVKGRVSQNWPFTLLEFWNQTKYPEESDYHWY